MKTMMRNGNPTCQIPLCASHRRIGEESAHQRIRIYLFIDYHAPIEYTVDGHLKVHKGGEESGFEDWAGSARAFKCDGDEEAESEEEVDLVDLVVHILEKGNARNKGTDWKRAGEVDKQWEDGADRDGESPLNYGGDINLLLFNS